MRTYELQNGFGLDSLRIVERPSPRPGPGEAVVRMRAWSLNYRDLLVVRGQYNPKLRFPFTPLSDGAGEVIAVGEGTTRVRPGDRVASAFMPLWIDGPLTEAGARSALGGGAPGVLAEEVVVPAEGLVATPAGWSDAEAATLPCAAVTAWHALVAAGRLSSGESVLVQGTGGVSLIALQIAKGLGARVIATSGSDEKLSRALALGADEGINYRAVPRWGDRVRELTGGAGVDHVVEVGGAGTLGESLRAVRMGGRISLIGVLAGMGQVDPVPILMKGVCVQGVFVGSRAMFEGLSAFLVERDLRPVIDRVFPFEEASAALRHMEQGAHFGKIVIAA